MKRTQGVFLIILGLIVFSQLSCGRKAAPFVPKERVQARVAHLKGEWKADGAVLKGRVAISEGREKELSDIVGCRVYHIRYPLDQPPCDGCPIPYEVYTEIKGAVIEGEEFLCRIKMEKEKGIHIFEVRLTNRKGTAGPASNRVKLIIEK